MTTITPSDTKIDFRAPSAAKRMPRAVADAGAGIITAIADIDGPPEAVFRALTSYHRGPLPLVDARRNGVDRHRRGTSFRVRR
jgi:hypothetical protein